MGGVKSEPSGASPVFSIRKYMMTRVFKRLPVLFLCLVCCRMPAFSQAVDLGLSVKWASCNVGASYPEEAGDYFAWGEVSTKNDYSLRTYRWSKMSTNVLLKYNVNSALGKEDGRTELELRDDAAHVLMGGTYRIPTIAEWTELHEKCRWIWTFRNGVAGYEVESPKTGRSIFLPAAGFRCNTMFFSVGALGVYWTSSLSVDYPDHAQYVLFYGSFFELNSYFRYYGQSIRAVQPY